MMDKSLMACLGGTLVKKTFEGGAFMKKTLSCASSILAGGLLLASMSGVLVKEPLAVGSLFLAGASGLLNEECHGLASTSSMLVEELLAVGSLFLVGTSGLLDEECLILVLLPIPVGTVCASASPMKNGPPMWPRRQQSGSLLVFADGFLMPFFVAKRSTNVGQGVLAFILVKQPLGGTWGRLRPFKLQPPGRIGEVGGQRSRQ